MENVQTVKKSTAILLTVFFSFWSALYTYHRDYRKFWVGFIVFTGFFALLSGMWLLGVFSPPGDVDTVYPFSILFIFTNIVIWVCVMVDTIIKSRQTYESSGAKTPLTAAALSILFGPLAWLYTFSKDKWKFWISLAALALSICWIPWLMPGNKFPYIEQLYKAGYVDLNWPLSLRLSYFWMYVRHGYEYYYVSHFNIVSLIVPILAWVYPVIENLFRLFKSKKNIQQTIS